MNQFDCLVWYRIISLTTNQFPGYFMLRIYGEVQKNINSVTEMFLFIMLIYVHREIFKKRLPFLPLCPMRDVPFKAIARQPHKKLNITPGKLVLADKCFIQSARIRLNQSFQLSLSHIDFFLALIQ